MLRFLAKVIFIGLLLSPNISGCGGPDDSNRFVPLNNVGDGFGLHLITYNILASLDLAALAQGYLPWPLRREEMKFFLSKSSADILAIQEATIDQLLELNSMLNHYELVTVTKSSDAAIFYRSAKFALMDKGHWQLPDAGFMNPPRIAIWAKLLELDTNREIMVISTHLDAHRKVKAKSVKELKTYLDRNTDRNGVVLLMGDFNISPEQAAFSFLSEPHFVDSFQGDAGSLTYPSKAPERRIDHIFYSGPGLSVSDWRVLKPDFPHMISDHFPVQATMIVEPGYEEDPVDD